MELIRIIGTATALEIVAKKLVDILGDKAAKLGDKDKTRAASYEAYYALKRIEETFAEISQGLDYLSLTYSDKFSEEELKQKESDVLQQIDYLSPKFDLLSELLEDLKAAFGKMEGKFEIYGSIEQAQSVRLYMGIDSNVLTALYNYDEKMSNKDVLLVASNMISASRKARQTIATFIRENYGIEEKESGR